MMMILCNNVLFSQTVQFTYKAKCFINILGKKKDGWATQICSEYCQKKTVCCFMNDLLRKIDKAGSVEW